MDDLQFKDFRTIPASDDPKFWPLDFMADLMSPIGDLPDGSSIKHYGYQIWLGQNRGHTFSSMNGLHGQYIVMVHDLDLVVVRTGFSQPKGNRRNLDVDVYHTIDFAMDTVGALS